MTPMETLRRFQRELAELSELELIYLLHAAADRARAFDASAGNHAQRAAHALNQDYADRHASSLLD